MAEGKKIISSFLQDRSTINGRKKHHNSLQENPSTTSPPLLDPRRPLPALVCPPRRPFDPRQDRIKPRSFVATEEERPSARVHQSRVEARLRPEPALPVVPQRRPRRHVLQQGRGLALAVPGLSLRFMIVDPPSLRRFVFWVEKDYGERSANFV